MIHLELTDAEARELLYALRVTRRRKLAWEGTAGTLTGLIDKVESARAGQWLLARWLILGSLAAIVGIVVWRLWW